MTTPVLTIVLATCAETPRLFQALAIVRGQLDRLAEPGELLVVVNSSRAEVGEERVAGLETLCDTLLFEPIPGKSHALNLGVHKARGSIIAFVDDDALPEPGWLADLVAPLLADPACGGAGGRILPVLPSGGVPEWYSRLVAGRNAFFLGPIHDLGTEPLNYAPGELAALPFGANCAYRRDLLLDIGYDTNLGPNRRGGTRGGEDTLLARMLVDRGHRLEYRPNAVVKHPVSPSRMTARYVLEGYFWQGVERVRINRALGTEVTRAKLWRSRLVVWQGAPFAWFSSWLPDALRVRLLKRRQRHRGMLAELGNRALSVRPLAMLLLTACCLLGAG